MPADRKSKPAPRAEAAETQAGDAEATQVAEAEEAPMNRAERRARGKGKTPQNLSVSKINPAQINPGHGSRQYSSRRSGGGGR